MIRKFLFSLALLLTLLGLGACSQPFSEREVPKGPATSFSGSNEEYKVLVCVVKQLPANARQDTYGVMDFIDKSGAVNQVGNESFGYFNTQGAADMLATAIAQVKLPLIELGPSYRALIDWGADKSDTTGQYRRRQVNVTTANGRAVNRTDVMMPVGFVVFPKYGLQGTITSTDFMPGEGASVGAFGASVGYERNWVLNSMDLRVVELPNDGKPGGKVIAGLSVVKQIHQESMQVNLTRVLASTPATIFNFSVGGGRREPMKYSTRAMIATAFAGLLADMYPNEVNLKGCM